MSHERTKEGMKHPMAALLIAALLLAGCGGSGSSGFDGEASSEPEAITRALDSGTCVEFEGVSYCSSDAPADVGGDTATVGLEAASDPVACADVPDSSVCVASIGFTPDGFPEGTEFLAVWAETVDGPWVLAATTPPPAPGSGSDGREVQATLPEPSAGTPPSPVVFAVLVYLSSVPSDLPAVADELADFSPDFAYVTSELSVAPASPGA